MKEQQQKELTTRHEKVLTYSALIPSSPEIVFDAFTKESEIRKWLGPVGVTCHINKLDVRPGGNIQLLLQGQDGTQYTFEGTFIEIVYPEKLVFLSNAYETSPGNFDLEILNTLHIESVHDSSRITMNAVIKKTNSKTMPLVQSISEGFDQSLDRLTAAVKNIMDEGADMELADEDKEIRSTRIFKASRELVFSLWTDAIHLAKWWGPKGFTITTSSFDFNINGTWDFIMHGPDGVDYRNKIRYKSIKAPERIEYEHITGPVHRVIVLFEETGNETTVHFRMIFATAALRNKVASQFGAIEGLEEMLNRLKELIG